MESAVESEKSLHDGAMLQLRLLGPLTLSRDGAALALPGSRKVRALLGYLALAPRPVARGTLCELLWEMPNDPRGELRWCLSKVRGLIGAARVVSEGDTVALDLSGCTVDARTVLDAEADGLSQCDTARLRELAGLFAGDLLDGLALERSPAFDTWLAAQRRRFRGLNAAVLEAIVARDGENAALADIERWLALAPLDAAVHARLLAALVRHGRLREGEEHVAAARRLFAAEGLETEALDAAWRAARAGMPRAIVTETTGPPVTEMVLAPRRASIAVMPFQETAPAPGPADALAHDIITRLAKLRSLFVIAQGTVYALHERAVGAEEAGRLLQVDYVVHGSVQRQDRRLSVTVELTEMRSGRIVWAEIFAAPRADALMVLEEIGNKIVAAIASEIETIERNRAILKPPNSLDAWEAHHRGLWHMYRFTPEDNAAARHFFEIAVRLDPTFARAHAGLSFTHFQDGFQGWAPRAAAIEAAYAAAGQSLMADDRDPAAHWAMGRALWLRGRHDQSFAELEQAVALSPNFAQGHYTIAFAHSQIGDAATAIAAADHSRKLSPFDPLLFAMLGARAMALVRLKRFDEAADWAVRAAARPNAHEQILAIAAFSLALAGRLDEARTYLAAIHATRPGYRINDFLAAMQFDADGERLFRHAAEKIGAG